MKKLTILCDYDDVLFPLVENWVIWLNNKYNTNTKFEDITNWDMKIAYPFLTDKELWEPLNIIGFYESLIPYPDGVEYVTKMIEDGHKVKVVTSAHYDANIKGKIGNLLKYYPFNEKDVQISWDKQGIKGDILIDDGIHNLEGGDFYKLLKTMPQNKFYNAEQNGMKRVNNMKEAYETICELAKINF